MCIRDSLGGENDAQTSNTRIAQRKHVIPQSTMKNNRNIIECCNNTHQGALRTGKQMIRTCVHRTAVLASPYSAILYTQNMHVEWKIVTGNPQVTRKLTKFAKYAAHATSARIFCFGPQ